MDSDKPLVTLSMTTYNHEHCVRDAVRGALAQTYEPLEIIISDDCSTDRTWEIVCEEVAAYKKAGGIHQNIVLNRNETNLGIAKHQQKLKTKRHGVLSVAAAGDDISMPERVSRIVDAWLASGRKATLIMHDATLIDESGRTVGHYSSQTDSDVPQIRGAVATYSCDILEIFPPIEEVGAFEDWILSARCTMFGPWCHVDGELIKYRLGGISTVTSLKGFRRKSINASESRLASIRQIRRDMIFAQSRGANQSMIEAWSDALTLSEYFQNLNLLKLSGGTFGSRLRMFRVLTKGKSFLSLKFWIYAVLLAPGFLTAPVYTLQAYRTARMNAKGGEL